MLAEALEREILGKNLDELRGRLDGFWLRRTQQDVGIGRPFYDLLPMNIALWIVYGRNHLKWNTPKAA